MAVKTMERQANARDFKSIVDGIDPEFRSHGGLDKKGLHALLSTLEARHGVKMIQVKRPDVISPNADGTFPCEFTMRLTGDFGEFVVLVKTTWKKKGRRLACSSGCRDPVAGQGPNATPRLRMNWTSCSHTTPRSCRTLLSRPWGCTISQARRRCCTPTCDGRSILGRAGPIPPSWSGKNGCRSWVFLRGAKMTDDPHLTASKETMT